MQAAKPLKILVVCENASSRFGGEAMLPLNYFRLISQTQHQVFLITHERVKPGIERMKDIHQAHVFYVPDTKLHRFLNRLSRYIPERQGVVTAGLLMHMVTQFYQWKLARKLVKENQIDIVHEPAPVSATQPSAMFALGAPVVIGPMNGGMSFPPAFAYMSSAVERSLYKCTRMTSTLFNLLMPGKLFAKALLVANQRTAAVLPRFKCGRVIELVENGVFSVVNSHRQYTAKAETQVLYVGRLIELKMVEIAIEAIHRCQQPVRLRIVGDGAMRAQLEAFSKTFPSVKVEFIGAVSHDKVNQYYDEADVFVLPSVRECGGAVVLEAMARGLPVIATDWGGPADYLTPETGFLVRPDSKEYMIAQFSQHIDQLANQPALRRQLGMAAIDRIRKHFMWDIKVEKMLAIYQDVIETHRHSSQK